VFKFDTFSVKAIFIKSCDIQLLTQFDKNDNFVMSSIIHYF